MSKVMAHLVVQSPAVLISLFCRWLFQQLSLVARSNGSAHFHFFETALGQNTGARLKPKLWWLPSLFETACFVVVAGCRKDVFSKSCQTCLFCFCEVLSNCFLKRRKNIQRACQSPFSFHYCNVVRDSIECWAEIHIFLLLAFSVLLNCCCFE